MEVGRQQEIHPPPGEGLDGGHEYRRAGRVLGAVRDLVREDQGTGSLALLRMALSSDISATKDDWPFMMLSLLIIRVIMHLKGRMRYATRARKQPACARITDSPSALRRLVLPQEFMEYRTMPEPSRAMSLGTYSLPSSILSMTAWRRSFASTKPSPSVKTR